MAYTPRQRQIMLERFLTDTNNKLSAVADIVSAGVNYDAQVVLNQYSVAVQKLVAQLETDGTGRLLATEKNAGLLRQLEVLNGALRATPEYIAARAADATKRLVVGLSRWMATATKTAAVVSELSALSTVVEESFAKLVSAAGPAQFESGAARLMNEVSAGVTDAVVEGIRQYATTKERLQSLLFTDEPEKVLRERTQEFADRAKRGAAELHRDIARIEQGQLDVEQAQANIAERWKEYKEARKEYLSRRPNQGQVLRQTDSLGNLAAKDARKRIMNDQQNELIKSSVERFGEDAVYVNAKNTDFDDNCFDAAEAEPMTLEEWEVSEFGPPRSSKRDCGENCKCLLIPVGNKSEQVVASGDQLTET